MKLPLQAAAMTCVLSLSTGAGAHEPRIVPTTSIGVFMEFGDEYGTSGGFAFWLGAALYPSVEPRAEQITGFISLGVQARTGFLPLLTGPNEVIPQLRAGLAVLGGTKFVGQKSVCGKKSVCCKKSVCGKKLTCDKKSACCTASDCSNHLACCTVSDFVNLTFPVAKLYGSVGYRWAFGGGMDNMEDLRKDEQALRLGIGFQFSMIGFEFFFDVDRDKRFDRWGFELFAGF